MASGKETPRQKMINLMYLVFIAMLALNMSKEVLSAFGMITEQTEDNTARLETRVLSFKASIDQAVDDDVEGFDENFSNIADSIQLISDNYDNYISSLLPENITKNITIKKTDNKPKRDSIINDYEIMDTALYFNDLWFANSDGKLTDASTMYKDELPLGDRSGEEFINKMNEFRTDFVNLIVRFNPDADTTDTGKSGAYAKIIDNVNDLFSTDGVVNREGTETSWLEYHFYGYPEIASKTKLAVIQSNIRSVQAELYSAMLGGQYQIIATLANFDAYVVADRSSYYTGTNFTGKIVLGKKSDDLSPKSAVINDIDLLENENAINSDGSINLDFRAGNRRGTNTISGNVIFMEDGKEILIPVTSSYEVVDKPNKAAISADKMRVVYVGVPNPISISFSGIDDNNVTASAPGLIRTGSGGSYSLDLSDGLPSSLQEQIQATGVREITINVRGNLEGGEVATDNATFEIKPLPKPIANIAGFTDKFSYTRFALSTARIKAKFDNAFAYQLDLSVFGFVVDVPGQPAVTVKGNVFDDNAKNALRNARRGSIVTISDIKVRALGTEVDLKQASSLIINITD